MTTQDGVRFELIQRTRLGAIDIRVEAVDGKKLATFAGSPHSGPLVVSGHDLDNALANARALWAKEKKTA